MPDIRAETMTFNRGPQHPSTHGVLRIVLELDGETVLSASPTIGYLHTGIEKTAEQKKWVQVIPLVERMDYLSAQSKSCWDSRCPSACAGSACCSPSCSVSTAILCGLARTGWKSAPYR